MSLRAPFIMWAILSRRCTRRDRREHAAAAGAVATKRVEAGRLVSGASRHLFAAPAAHAARRELRAHRGPKVDIRLVPALGRDDARPVRGPLDLPGDVVADLEAAGADARPDRGDEARAPAGCGPPL